MCPFAVDAFGVFFISGLEKGAILVKVVHGGTPKACTHTLTVGGCMFRVPLLTFETLGDRLLRLLRVSPVKMWDAFVLCIPQ